MRTKVTPTKKHPTAIPMYIPVSQNSVRKEVNNSKYVNEQQWNVNLNTAFNKMNQCINNNSIDISKQYNEDYNIHRGQIIGIQHILSIIFYSIIYY